MSTNTESTRKPTGPAQNTSESALAARTRQSRGEQGNEADPFADKPAAVASGNAGVASSDPFADSAETTAAQQPAAAQSPVAETATAETTAEVLAEAETGGVFGLFGSALSAINASGLLGPSVGLASIAWAAGDADSGEDEEPFFSPQPEASRTSVGSAEVGGQDAAGNTTALSLENTAIRLGGNEEPVIKSDSLTLGNSSGEAPGEIPVTIDVGDEAPIFNIHGGALAEGDVMVYALQTSVSAQNLVTEALTRPDALLADPINTNLGTVAIAGQPIPIPSDITQPLAGGGAMDGGGMALPISPDDLQAALGGGADFSAVPIPMSSNAGGPEAFASLIPTGNF